MSTGRYMALELVRATEAAALAAAHLMGRGDEAEADRAAVHAMWTRLNQIEMDALIVIGEGERDEAPMLHLGERVGKGSGPVIEIALDPLEGPMICATGGPNALSAIAAVEGGGFLRVQDTYMDKIAVGPEARGVIDIDQSPSENLKRVAEAKGVPVQDLTIVILDRPRHEGLIEEVRADGVRVKLIKDGDMAAAIATCSRSAGVDMLMGVGGAAEGVIAAAALSCIGGELQGRLKPRSSEEVERAHALGVGDVGAKLIMSDLISGDVMFAATGVTSGDLLKGVRFGAEGALTQSIVVRSATGTLRYIDAEHPARDRPV